MTRAFIETITEKLQREFNPNETLQLLKYSGAIMMSWGCRSFTNIKNKGLSFLVSGHHHKGYVLITLGWDDTYSFYLINNRGKVKYEQHQVYFDMLVDAIDEKVERIAAYK